MPGRVVQERRARSTGTVVQVIDRGSDLWSERWETRCADHQFVRSNPTRAGAVSFASCPERWCDQCYVNTGSRIRYATDEDVERLGLVIGFPVRPKPPTAEQEQSTGS